jgi:hypothetical protein
MRDASCRGSALAEHRRDLAPAIHASEADLAASHEAEEQDERRVLGRQATLSLHPPPELLVQPLNHVRRSERLPLALGELEEREQFLAPSARLRTTPGQRRRHFRSKAAEPPWAAARLSA